MRSNGCVALAILMLAYSPILESHAHSDLLKPAKNNNFTYLLTQIFPGIKDDGTAKKSVSIRGLRDGQSSQLDGEMTATISKSLYVRNGTSKGLVLEIEVTHKDESAGPWGGETLLAFFKLSGQAKLLDVIDVRSDRESGLWNKPAVLRGDRADALLTYCSHLNAGEEYFVLDLIEIAHDKLVHSKVNFPLIYNARTGNAEIAELPSILTSKQSPNCAIFRVSVTGKLLDENGGVKKIESQTFQSRLIFSKGRWRCPSCAKVQKSIRAIEARFGFTNE